jgi:hypothetical protein
VLDQWICACVAFNTMAFQQHHPIPKRLAKAVIVIDDDSAYGIRPPW